MSPYALRGTFCSLLYALEEDPGMVMDAMRRGEDGKAALCALIQGGHWANMGERGDIKPSEPHQQKAA
jgi:hypothetical protein